MLVGILRGTKLSWDRPCVQIQAKLQWDPYSCPILPPAFVEKFSSFRGILLPDTRLNESPWWRSGLTPVRFVSTQLRPFDAEQRGLNKFLLLIKEETTESLSNKQEVRQKNLNTTLLSSRPQWLEVTFLVFAVKLGHCRSLTALSL